MNYLIDTNICIYIMNQRVPSVTARFHALSTDSVGISEITVSELAYGVEKSQRKAENTTRLSEFLMPFTILPYQAPVSKAYAEIRTDLERRGQVIGPLDMLLAAHAIAEDLTLVTNNTKEFQRINGLKLENWV